MKRAIPTAGLVMLPKSGHTINLEEPEAFNRALEHFLTAVEAGKWGTQSGSLSASQLSYHPKPAVPGANYGTTCHLRLRSPEADLSTLLAPWRRRGHWRVLLQEGAACRCITVFRQHKPISSTNVCSP